MHFTFAVFGQETRVSNTGSDSDRVSIVVHAWEERPAARTETGGAVTSAGEG